MPHLVDSLQRTELILRPRFPVEFLRHVSALHVELLPQDIVFLLLHRLLAAHHGVERLRKLQDLRTQVLAVADLQRLRCYILCTVRVAEVSVALSESEPSLCAGGPREAAVDLWDAQPSLLLRELLPTLLDVQSGLLHILQDVTHEASTGILDCQPPLLELVLAGALVQVYCGAEDDDVVPLLLADLYGRVLCESFEKTQGAIVLEQGIFQRILLECSVTSGLASLSTREKAEVQEEVTVFVLRGLKWGVLCHVCDEAPRWAQGHQLRRVGCDAT
mmetsp:Transcript_23077/g.52043  ORF Transcript_23077/g.52043 Transcript_23077/m.52043 type:complete len:275 (-) Transcript_23077:3-827(-)